MTTADQPAGRTPRIRHKALAAAAIALAASAIPAPAQTAAQTRTATAQDPEVQAATRLFSAWLEGQIADRGTPGVMVGVIHDQQLVRQKGFGFQTRRTRDRSYIGHGGGYPGYTTETLFQLAEKFGVVVLTNSADSKVGEIARQLIAAVGPAVGKAATAAPSAAWDPGWALFQGIYRNLWGDVTLILRNDRLVALASNAPGIEDFIPLHPLGAGRFRHDAPAGGPPRRRDRPLHREKGLPTRMHIGDSWYDRIPGR